MWFSILSETHRIGVWDIFFDNCKRMVNVVTDRAGRPGMESTHKTIQAYLASQGNDFEDAEKLMEQHSSEAKVSTSRDKILLQTGQ